YDTAVLETTQTRRHMSVPFWVTLPETKNLRRHMGVPFWLLTGKTALRSAVLGTTEQDGIQECRLVCYNSSPTRTLRTPQNHGFHMNLIDLRVRKPCINSI